MTAEPAPPGDDEVVTDAVRERVYAAITGLATVVTLYQYAADTSSVSAAASLLATMVGLFGASFVSDLITHSTVRGSAPSRATRRQLMRVAAQALEVGLLPVVLILISGSGLWQVRTGLVLAATALVLTQLALVLWGLRRTGLSLVVRLRFLLFEAVAVAAVVGIKVLAH